MSKVALLLLLSFVFLPVQSKAQNLISDPGFEIWDGQVGQVPSTLDPLTFWYNANGTADHHHQLNPPGSNLTSLEPCPTGQGQTQCGFPFEGQGVLGCWKGNGSDGTREWAGIELTESLVEGGCYEISFQIQNKEDNPDFLMATSNWGIFFSETALPSFNPNLADYDNYSGQFVMVEELFNNSDWQKFEFDYQSDGNYPYAFVGYVGNFDDSDFTAWSSSFSIGFYLWFDDIQVVRIDPQLTLTDDIIICPGESVDLEATSNFPIHWEANLGNSNLISVSPTETTTYYVQTQDSTACSIRDSVIVSIFQPEELQYPDVICQTDAPFLLDENIGSGRWSGEGIIDSLTGLFDPYLTSTGLNEIQFISDVSCLNDFILQVDIGFNPPVEIIVDISDGCTAHYVYFTYSSLVAPSMFNWDFGDGQTSIEAGPFHVYEMPGTYDIKLNVTRDNGCVNGASLPILLDSDQSLEIPNAFSPNGDGINDTFSPITDCLISFFDFRIYDRWGDLVFVSTDSQFPWDGNIDGDYALEGVYVYTLEYSYEGGSVERRSGEVSILR